MTSDLNNHQLETYKSLVTISVEGFKYSMAINGGAAIAILAYLSNVAGKTTAPDFRFPMTAFLTGVVCCGVSFCGSYLTQLKLFNEAMSNKSPTKHAIFLYATLVFYLLSVVAFGVGAWLAVSKFK